MVAAVLDLLGSDDNDAVRRVRTGKKWAGGSRFAASMTKPEAQDKETVQKLEWLFPGYFAP